MATKRLGGHLQFLDAVERRKSDAPSTRSSKESIQAAPDPTGGRLVCFEKPQKYPQLQDRTMVQIFWLCPALFPTRRIGPPKTNGGMNPFLVCEVFWLFDTHREITPHADAFGIRPASELRFRFVS